MLTPQNFDCAQAADLLDDYRRNNLDPHLRVMLAEHLETCESCAAELQSRIALARAMQTSLPDSAPSPHLPPEVRRAIAAQAPATHDGNHRGTLLPWMLTAGVILTIGAAILQVGSPEALQPTPEIASAPARQLRVESHFSRTSGEEAKPAQAPATEAQPAATTYRLMAEPDAASPPPPPAATAEDAAAPAPAAMESFGFAQQAMQAAPALMQDAATTAVQTRAADQPTTPPASTLQTTSPADTLTTAP